MEIAYLPRELAKLIGLADLLVYRPNMTTTELKHN